MSPLCVIRLRDYPELQVPIDQMSNEDKADAQHQWAYATTAAPMQRCFEDDCSAVRPVPFGDYPPEDQTFIQKTFYRWLLGEVGEPLPAGQHYRHVP